MHKRISTIVFPVILALAGIGVAVFAEEPAYLSLKTGQTVEIEGDWDEDDSVFVADDIELLPVPRRPKLRGPILAADSATHRLRVFGQWIVITEETQFINLEEARPSFSMLRPGVRIEISCKVDSTGAWIARHLRSGSVKESNKIKGNIGMVHFGGEEPDVITIEGLPIRVNAGTTIYKTLGTVLNDDVNDERTD